MLPKVRDRCSGEPLARVTAMLRAPCCPQPSLCCGEGPLSHLRMAGHLESCPGHNQTLPSSLCRFWVTSPLPQSGPICPSWHLEFAIVNSIFSLCLPRQCLHSMSFEAFGILVKSSSMVAFSSLVESGRYGVRMAKSWCPS